MAAAPPESPPRFTLQLEPDHPWRPPFGLERVGRPISIRVESTTRPEPGKYSVVTRCLGKEIASLPLTWPKASPYSVALTLEGKPRVDEIALMADGATELARLPIKLPDFEAAAIARPDEAVNPVDLGTILVPHNWLLLEPGKPATLEFAALSRNRHIAGARLTASNGAGPEVTVADPVHLPRGERISLKIPLPQASSEAERGQLRITLHDGLGKNLWNTSIPVMWARQIPKHPNFGATYERLRYDAPISVRDPKTGKYSTLNYNRGWDQSLRDVVVWLPNGARFVFWRGSSYIPFWAGKFNTGACYEWAEILSQPKGAVDCVEPLMDKTLRYGRVEIVESTPARVHVRWRYQSTDLEYKVWGDQVVEDYYFYPDSFGTRVVTLKADPAHEYELSEFIILTPASAYPFDVLPENAVDAIFIAGGTRRFPFPRPSGETTTASSLASGGPAIYRLRLNRREKLSAIYFNPGENRLPPVIFGPFQDAGRLVTPCYWGSHWPLARGNATGQTIDDRIGLTPCHNSVMSWAKFRPAPFASASGMTLDSLGAAKVMTTNRWAWLIGMIDADDNRLREWAASFSGPPSLDVTGARIELEGYVIARRAVALVVERSEFQVTTMSGTPWINPVLELNQVPAGKPRVTLNDRPITGDRLAWDGRVLWLDATLPVSSRLRVVFETPPSTNSPTTLKSK